MRCCFCRLSFISNLPCPIPFLSQTFIYCFSWSHVIVGMLCTPSPRTNRQRQDSLSTTWGMSIEQFSAGPSSYILLPILILFNEPVDLGSAEGAGDRQLLY